MGYRNPLKTVCSRFGGAVLDGRAESARVLSTSLTGKVFTPAQVGGALRGTGQRGVPKACP